MRVQICHGFLERPKCLGNAFDGADLILATEQPAKQLPFKEQTRILRKGDPEELSAPSSVLAPSSDARSP